MRPPGTWPGGHGTVVRDTAPCRAGRPETGCAGDGPTGRGKNGKPPEFPAVPDWHGRRIGSVSMGTRAMNGPVGGTPCRVCRPGPPRLETCGAEGLHLRQDAPRDARPARRAQVQAPTGCWAGGSRPSDCRLAHSSQFPARRLEPRSAGSGPFLRTVPGLTWPAACLRTVLAASGAAWGSPAGAAEACLRHAERSGGKLKVPEV